MTTGRAGRGSGSSAASSATASLAVIFHLKVPIAIIGVRWRFVMTRACPIRHRTGAHRRVGLALLIASTGALQIMRFLDAKAVQPRLAFQVNRIPRRRADRLPRLPGSGELTEENLIVDLRRHRGFDGGGDHLAPSASGRSFASVILPLWLQR